MDTALKNKEQLQKQELERWKEKAANCPMVQIRPPMLWCGLHKGEPTPKGSLRPDPGGFP